MAYSVTPAPLIGYVSLSYVSVELYRFTDFETSEHLSVVRITNGKFLMPGVYPGMANRFNVDTVTSVIAHSRHH